MKITARHYRSSRKDITNIWEWGIRDLLYTAVFCQLLRFHFKRETIVSVISILDLAKLGSFFFMNSN